jgi:soluble lytic murein transglycosylase
MLQNNLGGFVQRILMVMLSNLLTLAINSASAANLVAPAPATVEQQYVLAAKRAYSGLSWNNTDALSSLPLRPYLDYYRLARDPKRADVAEVKAWLLRYQDELPVAATLRSKLLAHYSATQRDLDFLALYRERDASATERCNVWAARMRLSPQPEIAAKHALALYRDASTPAAACASAFGFLRERQLISAVDAETRFAALLASQQISSAASTQKDLSLGRQSYATAAILVERDAAKTLMQARTWPKTDAALRPVIVRALERLGGVNPVLAQSKLSQFVISHGLSEAEQLRVRSAIVRTAIIANLPQAGAWLDALPARARDAQSQEWGVRRALTAMQPELALARVQAMSGELAGSARWRYMQARLLQWLGREAQAGTLYQQAASDPTFYGFLAADRISSGYTLCPLDVQFAPKLSSVLLSSGALKRISAFKSIGERVNAKREWMFLINRMKPDERRQAGLMAALEGWGEFAILALNTPADRALYQARFPLLQAETLNTQAQENGLDSAFVAGLIRQESAWDPQAVSRANAIGLMQMLPSTAALTAKAIGFKGGIDLMNPALNLRLGTAHLAQLSEKYAGSPILMTAAYNAGPRAVAKWQNELYLRFPDLWIETIPYKETREYVTSVLAFSVIYDWRLDGKLQRLSSRIPEFQQITTPARTQCGAGVVGR